MVFLDPLVRFRIERGSEHLHQLGPRAAADPTIRRAFGGDRSPPRLTVVRP